MLIRTRFGIGAALALLASACASGTASQPVRSPAPSAPADSAPAPAAARVANGRVPLQALIVGGGPDKTHNQVAIENNVRYLGRVLPSSSHYRVVFTDGSRTSENVQFRAANRTLAYRATDLPRLDGAATLSGARAELKAIADAARSQPEAEVFLYFTGHGSPDRRTSYTNNWFSLWENGRFTVTELARSLEAFPVTTPIALVMVQCYSGAFGNVLFAGGDPHGALIEQQVAGFFAAVPERVAAGCTPAINEAEYRDFTSYFFAALTGQDRLGRRVSGADYNHDHVVGMDEAFAWTLIHDESIDTPICTSDTFLRRFVTLPDSEISKLSYDTLESWATPAQRAALEGLSAALHLDGDDRLRAAFERRVRLRPNTMMLADVRLIRFVNLARSVARTRALTVSGDEETKRRFARLLLAEARNPLQ